MPQDCGVPTTAGSVSRTGAWRSSISRRPASSRCSNPSGDCRIVFNGEIYNYLELRAELEREGVAFHTASDTEVLLAAYRRWDVECLSRLNGMFAFALVDRRANRLLLARDRAGEKPLFYRRDGRRSRSRRS